MKKILKYGIGILILATVAQIIYIAFERNKEFDYHNAIPKTIELASSDFKNNGKIPNEFSGNGLGISPALNWTNLPEGTKSIVILMVDYDVPAPYLKLLTVDHWVVFNVDPKLTSFQQDLLSSSLDSKIRFGKGLKGALKYKGPKPPMGIHDYYFRIYALSVSELALSKPSKEEVMTAMKGKVLSYGELIGKY